MTERIRTPVLIRKRVREIYGDECANSADPRFKHMNFKEVHHITPRSEDGTDEFSNLILLCFRCHQFTHELMEKKVTR